MIKPVHTKANGRDEQAAVWCMRLADAPLDSGEQAAFDQWIAADPQNARAFEEAVAVWEGIDAINGSPEMIRHRAEAVETLRARNARRWSRGAVMRWRWPAAAAACIALFALTALWFVTHRTAHYETGIGELRVVMLEDGSRLTLDAASAVEVRLDADRRDLALIAGRAKFDVAHDPLRPFSVRARDRVTVATGTSFSVELLPEQVRVVLYEGRVEVIGHRTDDALRTPLRSPETQAPPKQSKPAVVLTPGNELIASSIGKATQVVEADLTHSLSWETGLLSFEGEPLALAAERMNRHARSRIVIRDARAGSYRISGVFEAGDVEAFVEGVTAIYPLQVKREPDELALTSIR